MKLFLIFLTSFFISQNCMAAPVKPTVKAVASFSILADLVKKVGGDYVEVVSLVGPNEDAHIYQPTPNDSKIIAGADIVFINGFGFEGWMNRLIEASGYKQGVIVVSHDVTPLKARDNPLMETRGTTDDPHAWQSIPAVMKYVVVISQSLQQLDPLNAQQYKKNATEYLQRLRLLDEWVRDEIAKVPQQKRRIISGHDAFGYFSKEYGVQFLAPAGVNNEAEPSPEAIRKLIDLIKKEGIKTIFTENMTNEKTIHIIRESTHIELGGILYSDALSASKNPEDVYSVEPATDYISLMRHNVALMVSAMLKD